MSDNKVYRGSIEEIEALLKDNSISISKYKRIVGNICLTAGFVTTGILYSTTMDPSFLLGMTAASSAASFGEGYLFKEAIEQLGEPGYSDQIRKILDKHKKYKVAYLLLLQLSAGISLQKFTLPKIVKEIGSTFGGTLLANRAAEVIRQKKTPNQYLGISFENAITKFETEPLIRLKESYFIELYDDYLKYFAEFFPEQSLEDLKKKFPNEPVLIEMEDILDGLITELTNKPPFKDFIVFIDRLETRFIKQSLEEISSSLSENPLGLNFDKEDLIPEKILDNLRIFCKTQVKDRMEPIIGESGNSNAKFVEGLHVKRQLLQSSFMNFINSEASVFGLVGDAGVGKTSSMCSLALQSLENNFVFFYNAAIIESPIQSISQDLNLFFSDNSDSHLVLRKLNEIASFLNKTVIIFIDAIDESTNSQFPRELSDLAYVTAKLDNIKICLSCKLNIWSIFLHINDNNTYLYEELKKFHDVSPDLGNNPGYFLQDFNDDEINDLVPLYQGAFDFKGHISESLQSVLKNGFFLRIFSEVYRHREIPQEINDLELIKKYVKQSLEKTSIGFQSAIRTLSKIGEILITHSFSAREAFEDEGLDIGQLLEKLNFSLNQNLPEDLFSRNILIKSNNEDSYNVSFYYSKIRDYIICYHSFRLHKLDDKEFYCILELFYENHIGISAIKFYIENAPSSHQYTFTRFKKDKSLRYVEEYDSYLDHNFKSIKKEFDPETNGKIGILLPKDLIKRDGYALFPLKLASERRLHFESFEDLLSRNVNEDPLYEKGAKSIHFSNSSLMVKDQSEIIKKKIFERLNKIIEKGRLNEYSSDILLLEKVATILYHYHKKLGYNFNIEDYNLPRFDLIYPIDLQDLRNRIYRFRAAHFYRREKFKGENNAEFSTIDQMVENAFTKKLEIPKLNVTGDFPPFEELYKIVNILLEKGYSKIERHYLPYPDIPIDEVKSLDAKIKGQPREQIRISQYSEAQAKLYIIQFFKHLESCYKEVVEHCFPTFKDRLAFFSGIPHEYFFYVNDSRTTKFSQFGYRTSQVREFKIHFKTPISIEEVFTRDGVSSIRFFSFDSILHIGRPTQTVARMNTNKVDHFCVLRNWIYKFLREDFKDIIKEYK